MAPAGGGSRFGRWQGIHGIQGIKEHDTMRALGAGLLLLAAGTNTLSAQEPAVQADGPRVFQTVCSQCHPVTPPPKQAPPMSHVTAYYLRHHGNADSAAAAVAAWIRQPAAERSLLPPHAIERFGLMPAQAQLTESELASVARYVLSLADTAHVGRMRHDMR